MPTQRHAPTEKPLRVAYLLQRFPVLSETFILRELLALHQQGREQGVEVTIFSLLPPKQLVSQADALLPHTHYSPPLSWAVLRAQGEFLRRAPLGYLRAWANAIAQCYREPLLLGRVLMLLPKAVYFAQQMEQLQIQHVHCHFVWFGAIMGRVVADLLGIPYSVHVHAFDLFQRDSQDVRRQLAAATQVVTISAYNRRYIHQLCPRIAGCEERVEVVYCGVDPALFQPRDEQVSEQLAPAPLRPAPLRPAPLRIVSVGRLIEKKGHAVLIDACHQLRAQGIAFSCQIVGEGPLRNSLQARINAAGVAEQVRLCGPLPQEAVLELLQKSDLFVLPALQARDGDRDGIPIVLMEAMACGLPVVTTPISGIPELVTAGETGLLVADDGVDLASKFAAALEQLAVEPIRRRQLGEAARRQVVQRFNLHQNTRQLAAIFHRVAAQHHARAARASKRIGNLEGQPDVG